MAGRYISHFTHLCTPGREMRSGLGFCFFGQLIICGVILISHCGCPVFDEFGSVAHRVIVETSGVGSAARPLFADELILIVEKSFALFP